MNLKIADLFCGPGGLSQAFYEMGHKILFAIDKDSYSIETFKQNHPDSDSKVICGNIEDIFEENDKNILTKNIHLKLIYFQIQNLFYRNIKLIC